MLPTSHKCLKQCFKYLGLAVLLAAPALNHPNYLNHAARAQNPSLLKPFAGPQNAPSWKFGDEAKGWSMEEDAEEEGAFSLRSSQGAAPKGSISQAVDVGPGALVAAGEVKSEGAIEGAQWDAQVFDASWKQIAWISSEENDAFKLALAPDWKPFRREISLPEKAAHLVFYISARGRGAIVLRALSLALPVVEAEAEVESTNPNANLKIADKPRVQVLGARPYLWKSLLTGGVEYATGLVWSPKAPQNLFLRADGGGIWRLDRKSDSKSDRWVALMDNLPWKWSNLATIDSLAVDPVNAQVIYVAGGSSRWSQPHDLLKTLDGGKTWARLGLVNARGEEVISEGNGPDKQAGERLVVDPNNSRVLFFGSRNDGLFSSKDAGRTWWPVDSLPSRGAKWTGVTFVLFDASSGKANASSQVLYAGVHAGKPSDEPGAADVPGAVFQSRDGGRSWRKLEGGAPGALSPMRARVGAGGALLVTYAGTYGNEGGGVWKWSGAWSDITPPEGKGQPFCGLNFDPRDARRVVCAGTYNFGANVFLSRDGGATWSHRRFEKGNKSSGGIFLTDFPAWEGGPEQEWGGNASEVAFDGADPDAIWHLSFSGPTRLKNLGSAQWKGAIVGAGREQMTTAEGVSPSAGASFLSGVWDVGGFRYEEKDFATIPSQRLPVRKPDGSVHTGYETYRNGFQDIFDMDASPLMPNAVAVAGG